MKKNILILGAGLMQKPAILAAKELNCKVYLADGNPKAVCVGLADHFEAIDLKDRDSLVDYASRINSSSHLDAVFTAGTDFSANVAYIAEKFGLAGHSYQAALNASDKVLMRSCFKKAGVNSPSFMEVTKEMLARIKENPAEFLKNNSFDPSSFPYVVKPCDNMGGRGCRMINSLDELYPALETSISYSRSSRAIFEEYMDGSEYSIDSLVKDGKVTITGFARRHIFYPPYFIEMGHTMSARLSDEDYKKLKDEFEKAVFSLGLSNGVAKADIKLTSKGAMIGEIAARLSGGYMSGWTFPYASGINLTKQALLLALGQETEIELDGKDVKPAKTCAERAWLSIPGQIQEIYGYDKVEEIPCIKDLLPRTEKGDRVNFPLNNVEKCGNIISLSPDYDKALESAEKAISSIVVRLKSSDSQTENFLQQDIDTQFPPSAYRIEEKDMESLREFYENNEFSFDFSKWPDCIKKYSGLKDWNFRTIQQSVKLFREITACTEESVKNPLKFWRYLYRGGIQGILYLYDSKEI
ncbi:MAG: ATP-grasp domain-containing protein [Treponemataceae bacterium]|nr:ATP-grasp domain-containing protein [Treponemataceae bacterium]